MENKTMLNHDVVAAGKENSVHLLVKVHGPIDNKRKPLPINLSVVIDRSGSMGGAKLAYVKQAAQELVGKLGVKDRLSLVAYDSSVRVLIAPQAVRDKIPFVYAIAALEAGATTNLSGGWLQGCDFVGSGKTEKGVNRVMLLTDGLANQGVTDHNRLAAMARQKQAEGVTTTTFGVGRDYNEDLLSQMASEGGGAFYFIDNPDQAPALFAEELKDLYSVAGQNLQVSLETESVVRSTKQLYTYSHQQQGSALVYQLGDLYAEEERTQIFKLGLRELEEGESRLGRVTISYEAIQGEKITKVESVHEIVIQAVPAKSFKEVPPHPEVERLTLLQKVRKAREEALRLADRRKFEEAMSVLQEMADILRESGLEDDELQNEYERLLEEAKDMEFGRERYDTHMRKMQLVKSSSANRSARYEDIKRNLHLRQKLSQEAIERNGPPPRWIEWRGGRLDLTGHEVTVGSAPGNDIVLRERDVDPTHCRLEEIGGEWHLRDLGSRVGTIANAGLIHGHFRLSTGDVIRVGGAVLRLE